MNDNTVSFATVLPWCWNDILGGSQKRNLGDEEADRRLFVTDLRRVSLLAVWYSILHFHALQDKRAKRNYLAPFPDMFAFMRFFSSIPNAAMQL
jgi:hypothetical protein